jgi:serine/threonine-protein kinase
VRARGDELGAALAKLAEKRGLLSDLGVGSVIEDRFEIVRALGAGGMGVVYEGVDKTTNERVAIKVIQAGSAQQLDALQRFVREASSVSSIRHPAVVRMLHVGLTSDGLLFQVQELVEGDTLARARGTSRWHAADVARLGSVLAEALAAAHVASVVHRDVKPANVILTTAAPGLKLLDFGIAKLEDNESTSGTRTGAALGTPAFMAPEQIDGARDVTDRADVYAAAVTMFLLLTARYPFEGISAREIMIGHQILEAPDARTIEPTVPESLAVLLKKCLAKDPASRPTAKSLMHDLARIADDLGAAPLESIVLRLEREAAGQDRLETVAE